MARIVGRRSHRSLIGAVALALVTSGASLALTAPAAAATTINVPANQPTIQAGIDAASDGDTVLVAPGYYNEHLDFKGKVIVVRSAQGPFVDPVNAPGFPGTTIDPSFPQMKGTTAVSFHSGEAAGSVLEGFYIHGAPQYDVSIAQASPTIIGNVITGAINGIKADDSASLISENLIEYNAGMGGVSGGGPGLVIRDNVISHNYRGINVDGPGVTVEDNVIENNSVNSGIAVQGASDTVVRRNIIRNNFSSLAGGGISLQSSADTDIVDNLIVGNSAASPGGALWASTLGPGADTTGLRIVNNTMSDNSTPGVSLVISRPVSLYNNIITEGVDCSFGTSNLSFNNVSQSLGTCAGSVGTSGNISLAPLFIDAAAGDYQLQATSPSFDAGTNTAPALPSTDLRGVPRVWHGIVDQGAYEIFAQKRPMLLSDATQSRRRQPLPLGAASTDTAAVPSQSAPSAGAAGTAVSPGGSPARRLQLVMRSASRGVCKASMMSTRRWRTLRFW